MASRDISLKVTNFCDITPCSLAEMNRRFRDAIKFYTQGGEFLEFRIYGWCSVVVHYDIESQSAYKKLGTNLQLPKK